MTIFQTINTTSTKSTSQHAIADASHVFSKERFLEFRDAFRDKAHKKQLIATDILLYNIIRGYQLERGFTPITNKRKLESGEGFYNGHRRLAECKYWLQHSTEGYATRRHKTNTYLEYYKLTPEECELINREL